MLKMDIIEPGQGIPFQVMPDLAPRERLLPAAGETIAGFAERSGWVEFGLPGGFVEQIDGAFVPVLRSRWDEPAEGRALAFVAFPLGPGGGGNSQSVGAIVAILAIIVIAAVAGPWAGAALGGTLFAASTWATIVSSVIVAAGGALISHFLKPKTPKQQRPDDLFTASLSGNTARAQQPIPVQFGKLKFFPDFAAPPWADYSGRDNIYHALFCLGWGEFEIHEIGVGSTPAWTSGGGLSAGFANFHHEIVLPGGTVTLFPANVAVAPDVAGLPLGDPYGTPLEGGGIKTGPFGETSGPEWVGPFTVNPPGSTGSKLAIDLLWPAGAHAQTNKGVASAVGTNIVAEYRHIDDTGVPIGSFVNFHTQSYIQYSNAPVRKTVEFDLPFSGRVEVRMARTNAELKTNGTDAVVWGGARLFITGPNNRPGVTLLAVRMVADRRLSQYSAQQLYVIATAKHPVWTGSAWVTQAHRSPHWAAAEIWKNTDWGAGLPSNKLDLLTFKSQADASAARDETFDYRFTSEMMLGEALQSALRGVISEPLYLFDRLSVVRDEPRSLPAAIFTDFNILGGSAEFAYRFQDAHSPDGVIVQYLEEQTWRRADVPSSATIGELVKPARVQVPGITRRAQATYVARYMAAVNIHRRAVRTYDVRLDGQLLRRGDLVLMRSELADTKGVSVRVNAYDATARIITAHKALEWAVTGNHYATIRCPDGSSFGPVLVTKYLGLDTMMVLDAGDVATAITASGYTLAEALDRDNDADPAVLSFSVGAPDEFRGLVVRLEKAGDDRFRLSLAPDAPEIYEISTGSIPALPAVPPVLPANPLVVTGVNATLLQVGTALALSASWQPDPRAELYVAQFSLDYDVAHPERATWATIWTGPETSFTFTGAPPEVDIRLRISARGSSGLDGPWPDTPLLLEAMAVDYAPSALGYELNFADLASDAVEAVLASGAWVQEASAAAVGAKITLAAGTTPVGAAAAFDVKVHGGDATSPVQSGLRVEIFEVSPGVYKGRVVVTTDQFIVADPTLRVVPFAVIGGEVFLQGVTRFSDIVRSNSEDARGNPNWQLDPDGDARFSGKIGAAEFMAGGTIDLGATGAMFMGQRVIETQMWQANYHFYSSAIVSNIMQDRRALYCAGPEYAVAIDNNGDIISPVLLAGTVSTTATWLMPDGVIRTTANSITAPTGSSTPKGEVHPYYWDRAMKRQTGWPKKQVLWPLGTDIIIRAPAGAVSMTPKLWGGGGGGYYGVSTQVGGSGGFITGTIAVTPGDLILIRVPFGGNWADGSKTYFDGSSIFFCHTFLNGWAEAGKGFAHNGRTASGGGRCMVARLTDDAGNYDVLFVAGGGGAAHNGVSGTPGGPAGGSTGGNTGFANGEDSGNTNTHGAGGGGYEGGLKGKGGTNYAHPSATSVTSTAGTNEVPANTSDSDYTALQTRLDVATRTNLKPGYGYKPGVIPWGPTQFAYDAFANGAPGLAVITFNN